MKFELKYVYIFFLLVLTGTVIFIIQGLYQQETNSIKPVEFNRIDGYNPELGKISEISLKINNEDTISHNYTIQVFMNAEFFTDETVEILPGSPFSLSMTLPIEKQYDNNTELIEEPTHNASLIILRDDRTEPVDHIEFRFD